MGNIGYMVYIGYIICIVYKVYTHNMVCIGYMVHKGYTIYMDLRLTWITWFTCLHAYMDNLVTNGICFT